MSELPLEISCRAVRNQIDRGDPALLVDCREPQEHDIVAIQGATLLPMSELPQRHTELTGSEDRPLIVYCHHGVRSAQVVAWLREKGFSQAVSMAGGIDAWAVEIDPGMKRY